MNSFEVTFWKPSKSRGEKEILGSRQKLIKFQRAEDIERIFNRLRPKYPIRKYWDMIKGVEYEDKKLYNGLMREANKSELEEFLVIDRKIFSDIKDLNQENFKSLWLNKREYERHLQRRLKKGHIKNEEEYFQKVKEAFLHPDDVKWKKYKNDFKQKANRYDRLYYRKGEWWVDVFLENGKIVTAFEIEKDYFEILAKGDINSFEIININIKDVRNDR